MFKKCGSCGKSMFRKAGEVYIEGTENGEAYTSKIEICKSCYKMYEEEHTIQQVRYDDDN